MSNVPVTKQDLIDFKKEIEADRKDLKKEIEADRLEEDVKINKKIEVIREDMNYQNEQLKILGEQQKKDSLMIAAQFGKVANCMDAILQKATENRSSNENPKRENEEDEKEAQMPSCSSRTPPAKTQKVESRDPIHDPAKNVSTPVAGQSSPDVCTKELSQDLCTAVVQFLEKNDLTELTSAFTKEKMDMNTLMSLTMDNTENMKVRYQLRRRLVQAIMQRKKTMEDVNNSPLFKLLSKFNLTKYFEKFVSDKMNIDDIKDMTDIDLEDLGMPIAEKMEFNKAKKYVKEILQGNNTV